MSLSSFKEADNLESEIEQLSIKINELYSADKKRLLDEIIQEYKDYLTKEGFTLKHQDRKIMASYGSSTITLEVPPYGESYMGPIHVLKLTTSQRKNELWNIVINRGKLSSGVNVSVRVAAQSQEQRMSELKSKRDDLKSRVIDYKPINYSFSFYREDLKDKKNEVAASKITEVITAIFD